MIIEKIVGGEPFHDHTTASSRTNFVIAELSRRIIVRLLQWAIKSDKFSRV